MKKYFSFLLLATMLIITIFSIGCSKSNNGEQYVGDWICESIEPSLGRPAIEHLLITKQGNGFTATISYETYDSSSNDRTLLSWQKGLFKSTFSAELKNDILTINSNSLSRAVILNVKNNTIQLGNKVYSKDYNKLNIIKAKDKAKQYMTEYGKDCFLSFRFED